MTTRARAFQDVARLRSLASAPEAQTALAVEMLTGSRSAEAVLAALGVLARHPQPKTRTLLLERYAAYDADGVRRDAGGYLRQALVAALRPLALPADATLLERAASTYEVLPTSPEDVTGALRAAGLNALAGVDDELAEAHAVRLLHDRRAAAMSGEPAVSAARLLGAGGQWLALYGYAMHGAGDDLGARRLGEILARRASDRSSDAELWASAGPRGLHPEVVAECLRHLAPLPASLLGEVVDRWLVSPQAIPQLGLMDLLLAHPHGADHLKPLGWFLGASPDRDLCRYAVMSIAASRQLPFVALLAGLVPVVMGTRPGTRPHPEKQALLREGLALVDGLPGVREALAALGDQSKTSARRSR